LETCYEFVGLAAGFVDVDFGVAFRNSKQVGGTRSAKLDDVVGRGKVDYKCVVTVARKVGIAIIVTDPIGITKNKPVPTGSSG
jgi:hypothetical protein